MDLVALVSLIPVYHIGRRKCLRIERLLQLSGGSPKEIGTLTDELDIFPKIHDQESQIHEMMRLTIVLHLRVGVSDRKEQAHSRSL